MAGESFINGLRAQQALTPTDQFAQLGTTLGSHLGAGIGQALFNELDRGRREAYALQKAYDAGFVDENVARKNFPMISPENLPVEILPGIGNKKLVNINKVKEMAMSASALLTAEDQRKKMEAALAEVQQNNQPLNTLFQTKGPDGTTKQLPLPENLAPYGGLPVDTFRKLPADVFKPKPSITPQQKIENDQRDRALDISEGKAPGQLKARKEETDNIVAGLLGMKQQGLPISKDDVAVITTKPQAVAFVQSKGGDPNDPRIKSILDGEWVLPGWFGMKSRGKLTGEMPNTPAQAAAQSADPILALIAKKRPNAKKGEIAKVGGKPYATFDGTTWQKR